MTPWQLSALWDAWKHRANAWDRRAALMPWLYAEAHRDRKTRAEPWRIEDFMPGERKPEPVGQVDSAQVFAVGVAPLGLKAQVISAEEFQAIAAKRYTGPNGQQ